MGSWGQYPGTGPVPPAGRPAVKVGGWLLVVGGAIAFVGAFLPWVTAAGESLTGFDDFVTSDLTLVEAPGIASVLGGVIGIGFGVALVAAGRILALCILAIIAAAIGLIVGIGLLVIAGDVASWTGGTIGIGAVLQPIGPALALAGSIAATAKRR